MDGWRWVAADPAHPFGRWVAVSPYALREEAQREIEAGSRRLEAFFREESQRRRERWQLPSGPGLMVPHPPRAPSPDTPPRTPPPGVMVEGVGLLCFGLLSDPIPRFSI